jgi:hypothetical protein
MEEHRILLEPSMDAEDFAEAAEEAGWKLIAENEETKSSPYELIYRTDEKGKTTAHYVDDRFIMVRYAAARGPKKAAVAADIEELLDYVRDADALEEAERDREDLQEMVDWLMTVTALRDQAGHERLAKLVEKRLAHAHSAIRRAALLAASWLEWPDFRKTVERMAKDDPDKDVRRDAAKLAKAYALREKGEI